MKIRIVLITLVFYLIACSTQKKSFDQNKQTGYSAKQHQVEFIAYENDIVDTSLYILSILDFKDSLKFEYLSKADSNVAISVTVNPLDSLPINIKADIIDTIQFHFDLDNDEVYKYESAKDTVYNVKSGFLWHKKYGLVAQSNYTWGIRFLLSEFDDASFNEIHSELLPDSFWFDTQILPLEK